MTKYIALIGDIIDSKQIKERESFQESLKETFININKEYKSTIASNFTLTIGDEFQALLKVDGKLMQLLDSLYIQIPADFRLGLGYGEITTKIDPSLSIGADGEAFWKARDAIKYVYTNNYNGRSNILFKSHNEGLDSTINSLFTLTESLKFQWTDLQKETFAKMLEEGIYSESFNQQEFASKLGISESSLSKRLTASNIKIYLRGRQEITKILEDNYE